MKICFHDSKEMRNSLKSLIQFHDTYISSKEFCQGWLLYEWLYYVKNGLDIGLRHRRDMISNNRNGDEESPHRDPAQSLRLKVKVVHTILRISYYFLKHISLEFVWPSVNLLVRHTDSLIDLYLDKNIHNLLANTQRLQKLIYLNLFTDCFMKISLQSSEQVCLSSWNPHETVCKQILIN